MGIGRYRGGRGALGDRGRGRGFVCMLMFVCKERGCGRIEGR